MLKLVEYIDSSPYAIGLFGATSHDELHVSRVSDFARGDNDLCIRFDPEAREFIFTYRQREDDHRPWSVTSTEAQGIQTFKHLLHKRLRWFQES